jgi:hypothetical protein
LKRALQISTDDNVAVSLEDVAAGDAVALVADPAEKGQHGDIDAVEDIPFAHKMALEELEQGDVVVKYGLPVGRMTQRVARGGLVHVHNLQSERGLA